MFVCIMASRAPSENRSMLTAELSALAAGFSSVGPNTVDRLLMDILFSGFSLSLQSTQSVRGCVRIRILLGAGLISLQTHNKHAVNMCRWVVV